MRTPELPVVHDLGRVVDDALGECTRCADVVRYQPEVLGQGRPLLCRSCGLAALGLAGF